MMIVGWIICMALLIASFTSRAVNPDLQGGNTRPVKSCLAS